MNETRLMMSKQIKTKQRVKERGEVFTNPREVKAMCDLIPLESGVWQNIESTFLEPACGNGNFLVEIYERKLKICKNEKDGLKALNSIVGIDIMPDNVEESKARLREMYKNQYPEASEFALLVLEAILKNNIICGDSLKIQQEWLEKQEFQQLNIFNTKK